ncbi:chymotrypsin BII-like isoform X2 [Ischnura elegans]|uniref:chymotrypsin BII-like isoform X2 n=1 Tax=Ischnura elegans TaxID=197161 RepID=UPI001ED8B443|nr:chymotrypsin BII-like isoform X2 [Ischnura elegans]
MKLLLASLALTAFVCTKANGFLTPTLHNLGKIRGLKNGSRVIRPKISGGIEAKPGEYPFQAGLVMDNAYFCGATIINESFVITSASCANLGKTYQVFVGDTRLGKAASPRQSLISNDAIIHENFDPKTYINDIALIRLPYPLTFDHNIKKMSLAPNDDGFASTSGTISGWGSTYDEGDLSPTLRHTDVTIISNEDCRAVYGDGIADSMICTVPQNNKEGVCGGDYGGPLIAIYQVDSCTWWQFALAGISSFTSNKGCGIGPDGYTRVYHFVDWINSHIE